MQKNIDEGMMLKMWRPSLIATHNIQAQVQKVPKKRPNEAQHSKCNNL
jgi:hypothetical protein